MKLEMNISDRDKKLLIGVIAIALLFCSYWFGYRNISTKTSEIKTENKGLQAEYDELHDMYSNRKMYEAKIVENNAISDEIMSKYAANSTQEFQIMYLRELEVNNSASTIIENEDGTVEEIPAIGTWLRTYTIPGTPTSTLIATDANGQIKGNKSAVGVSFKADYDNMMTFLENVNTSKWKTGIDSVSITYSQSDNSYTGQINLGMFSITSADRVPESVDTTGVLIRDEENIFSSSTFVPNMTLDEQSKATQIRNDSDVYVLVNPWGASLDSVIAGFTKDNTGKNNIAVNENAKQDVTITISGSNGDYKAAYKIGSQSIEATAFYAGESIDILISSSRRTDDLDVVSANVNIINNSDTVVNYTVINDDINNGRVIVNKTGSVDVY